MSTSRLDRRTVLKTAGAWGVIAAMAEAAANLADATAQGGGAPAAPTGPATLPAAEPFNVDTVKKAAERLAAAEFHKPKLDLPEPFSNLTYDQYRDIRFRVDQSIWRGEKLDYELQLFPIGFLYDIPVDIYVVDGAGAHPLKADGKMFSLGPLINKPNDAAPFAFSGFRIHGPLNRSDYFDEYCVFQGASYFRAVARGQAYGMSARGLAINTARPGGEEFPFFKTFWIERPKPGATEIIVHALLDSPSTTGAYRFAIQPGASTIMDIDATLYPRKAMSHIGLGCLTSMFLYGAANRRIAGDFRPAVHDSQGLAMLNGNGERLWRPLTNPKKLQSSAFMDKDPKGFGLTQRDRSFQLYQDLEAHYERRPSVWVEPKGQWGIGSVELIEIPAEEEIHDNIVAYWKPGNELLPGHVYAYSYRLYWTEHVPVTWTGARVRQTFVGASRKQGTLLFVVDFDGPALKDIRELPVAQVIASAGTVTNTVVQNNPEISGVRVSFELTPGGTDLIELRLALKANDQLISESWLYRWTKS